MMPDEVRRCPDHGPSVAVDLEAAGTPTTPWCLPSTLRG
jgi:hypothetical protein